MAFFIFLLYFVRNNFFLMALSPLDDRYASKVSPLDPILSESGLIKYRIQVEVEWLIFLSEKGFCPELDTTQKDTLRRLYTDFSDAYFYAVKDIEKTTNHDVKAVEIFLRNHIPEKFWSWIHFGCTSEDINNTSYAIMLRSATEMILNTFNELLDDLGEKALKWKGTPMLSRTHGQTATPTTVGKEMAVFLFRLNRIVLTISSVPFPGKFSGATGNFAAHIAAFPDQDWTELSQEFVENRLELQWAPLTTQIENHDSQAELLNNLSRFATVSIDLCRDMWGYISLGYFGQKVITGEVGSSTMPHKVNPIDFENAEGNFKIARGIARTLADELPISRWQRDLTDSTLQRNFGLVFGHILLALTSLRKGLSKVEIKEDRLLADLQSSPEVLTEAVQTVLRAHGHHDAYDQLKNFSRGNALSLEDVRQFIANVPIPEADKKRLSALTPETYTGMSEKLVDMFVE